MAKGSKKGSTRGGPVCLLMVALFWNGIVGVFDAMLVGAAVQSFQAQGSWEPMEASILESRVESHRGSENTTYRPVIRYRYRVGPEVHVSDRVAFFHWGSSNRALAERTQERYPVGATVTAYHDPDDPSEAALDISTEAIPAFAVLFLVPFHVIGFGILVGAIMAWRRRNEEDEDPVRTRYVVVDRGGHVVIRRPAMGPRMAFGLALLGSSFCSIFLSLAVDGAASPWAVVLGFIGGCLALSAVAAVFAHRRLKRPDRHLHIDHGHGVFAFPADSEGAPINRVEELELESRETNLIINDVRQYDHRLVALVDGRPHDVFALRGAQEDGDAIKSLIETEFGRARGPEGSGQRRDAEAV